MGQHWISLDVQGINPDEVEKSILQIFPEADIEKNVKGGKMQIRVASSYEVATVNGKLKEIVGHDTPSRLIWRDWPRENN